MSSPLVIPGHAIYVPRMSLEPQVVRNALLMPFEGTMDYFRAGVFRDGECLPESLRPGKSGPAMPRAPERRIAGAFVYGGYLFRHYGHFLMESLSRLYAVKRCGNLPLLFISADNASRGYIERWLRFLRIPNEVHVIRRPTEVEELIVAPAGCGVVDPFFIIPEQFEVLGVYNPKHHSMTDEKIWLSRSRINNGGLVNETDIETTLAAWGWRIAHPEELPLEEQIRLISMSRYVAGLDGSAFFTALLARHVFGKFFVFSRRRYIPELVRLALSGKRIDFEEHIPQSLEHISGRLSTARSRLSDPEEILGVLRGV